MGCHFLLWETFLTQELNPGLLHYRQILYHLSHQGSPLLITSFMQAVCLPSSVCLWAESGSSTYLYRSYLCVFSLPSTFRCLLNDSSNKQRLKNINDLFRQSFCLINQLPFIESLAFNPFLMNRFQMKSCLEDPASPICEAVTVELFMFT